MTLNPQCDIIKSMNRRDFLKSLMALPSLALPFIPSFLKPIWGKTTGTFEVAGLGFAPNIILWPEPQRYGETIESVTPQIDIASFDTDGFTLNISSPGTVHYVRSPV